ncbi:MAG: hypothetical protein AB8G22_27225 [Saprospiraceae bacterium]
MSKSYHATYRDLKGKTRKKINEMVDDPDSILHELAKKGAIKREVNKRREIDKQRENLI